MSKIIEKTIISKTPPKNTNVLWDNGVELKIFRNGVGGYAHITTAYGIDTYYNIAEDGSITVDISKKSLMERVEALEQILL